MRHVRHAHVRRSYGGAVVVGRVVVDNEIQERVELRVREVARMRRVDRIDGNCAVGVGRVRVRRARAHHFLNLERVGHSERAVAVGVAEDAVGCVGARVAGLQPPRPCRARRREDQGSQELVTASREPPSRWLAHQKPSRAGHGVGGRKRGRQRVVAVKCRHRLDGVDLGHKARHAESRGQVGKRGGGGPPVTKIDGIGRRDV